MGIKTCDLHTVALCPPHHGQLHQKGTIGDWSRDRTNAELWKAIAVQLRNAVVLGLAEQVRFEANR
jgi:hypothetical protein